MYKGSHQPPFISPLMNHESWILVEEPVLEPSIPHNVFMAIKYSTSVESARSAFPVLFSVINIHDIKFLPTVVMVRRINEDYFRELISNEMALTITDSVHLSLGHDLERTKRVLRDRYFGITDQYVIAVLKTTCPICFPDASMAVPTITVTDTDSVQVAATVNEPVTISRVRNLGGISRFFIMKMTDFAQMLLPWYIAVLVHEPTKLTILGHVEM